MIMLNVDGEDLTTVIRDGLVGDGDGDDNSDVDDGGAGDQVPGKDRSTLFMSASSEDHRPQSRQCPIQKQKLPTRPKNKLQMLNNSVYICLVHPIPPVGKLKKPSLRGNEHLRGAQCIGYYNIGNAFCRSARLATFAYDCLAGF